MAKTTRKGAPLGLKSSVSLKLNPRFYPLAKLAGKSINAYKVAQARNRKLSIAESTSSESSDGLAGKDQRSENQREKDGISHSGSGSDSDLDSDSSLTAMSEELEKVASRKGSVFFDTSETPSESALNPKPQGLRKSGKQVKTSKSSRFSKGSKASKGSKTSRKAASGKSIYSQADSSSGDEDDYNMDDEASDSQTDPFLPLEGLENINDEDDAVGLEAIYSMVGGNTTYASSDSEGSNEEDSADEDDADTSSSDDSEVDFVKLQVEQRRNNAGAGNARPNTEASKNGKDIKNPKPSTKKRKSSVYRRRSQVALPEDLNFKFEFDGHAAELAISDENEDEKKVEDEQEQEKEEEDLGEELNQDLQNKAFEFQFDQPLIDVPKINEDELNSDDEYEFDDNDLLATLQADNDLEEFITKPTDDLTLRVRQGSLSSLNDEENEDSFLKEEEKYLVNEFETNGFDDEELDAERLATVRAMNSFNEMDGIFPHHKPALQYASSSDGKTQVSDGDDLDEAGEYDDDEDDDDDDDGGDYVDFMDFDLPFFDEPSIQADGLKEITSLKLQVPPRKQKKAHFPKKKKNGPLDSEDDDDSYLWNYFFSSDAESASENDLDQYDPDEQLILEEVFRQNLEERKKEMERDSSLEPVDSDRDQGYDSSESTDVDLSLPTTSANSAIGSKLAKEVLSSKTADYRPPVLGTWAAIDSKPFGIIDGLSTRTLNNPGNAKNPRTKNWRGVAIKTNPEELAIELEELLNVSELDNEDENDARIWRDFNNNKKHVPLGAFRNKAHITHPIVVAEPMTNYNVSKNTNFNRKRRHSNSHVKAKLAQRNLQNPVEADYSTSLSKDLNLPSKLKMRRASMADAVSEGYRPTKSGLFSENVLADVEEVLGEDRDFMALVSGI